MSNKGFSHIRLSTHDLDATRDFYEKVLGFEVVRCDVIKIRRKTKKWSGRRDLNSRPPPWQGGALPLSHFRSRLLVLVPRDRLELSTPAFSVPCSTT